MTLYLLSQILDSSAARSPNQEAFRCEGRALTYALLLQKANGLAQWLVAHGVKRGDRVGIYLSKSLESAIAIYGIWKAGAAYVPLNPSAPTAQGAYAINHCAIQHLVTQKSKRRKLPALIEAAPTLRWMVGIRKEDLAIEVPVECCDWSALPVSDTAPDVRLVAQDLAYIMYTSGSTGTPKGMMHTHYSGLSYAQLAASTYGLNERDRIGNHSPLHFDISTLGFFAGPLVGATTVIIPEAYTKVSASLSQLIQDEALTVWYSVPLALSQLQRSGVLTERDLSALRWVLFAGEPFPVKYLYALMSRLPQARFSNIYGPAEVNQCTYYHVPSLEVQKEVQKEGQKHGQKKGQKSVPKPVPIGQIWGNSEAMVVNEENQPVAAGEVGELLVRSATMMSGYWQRPDLNAKAFFHTQVANQPAVFYRTGDLVREQAGQYQFIGRKDRQIKTRGYRVELDAVEAALMTHSQIEEAATYALPDETGSYQVGAAVILKSDSSLEATEIKRYLSDRLPSYAIPSDLSIATSFPRTGTGKIDRRKLQQMATKVLAHK